MQAREVIERELSDGVVFTSRAPTQYPANMTTTFAGSGRESFQVPIHDNASELGRQTDSYTAIMPNAYNWFRKYDGTGNVNEEGLYWGDSLLICRWVYLYNDKGNKVEANLYNAQRSLLVRCLYDEENTLVKRLIYKDGSCDEEIEYEYDAAAKLIGSIVHRADGSTSRSAHLRM